jgi:hypothetical protein
VRLCGPLQQHQSFRRCPGFILLGFTGIREGTVADFGLDAVQFGDGFFLVQRLLQLFVVLLGT